MADGSFGERDRMGGVKALSPIIVQLLIRSTRTIFAECLFLYVRRCCSLQAHQ